MSLSQAYVGTVVIKESMMMIMMFGHSSSVRKVCIEYRASKQASKLPERSKREGGIVFTS